MNKKTKLPPSLPLNVKLALARLESRLGKRLFAIEDRVSDAQNDIRVLKSEGKRGYQYPAGETAGTHFGLMEDVESLLQSYLTLLEAVGGAAVNTNDEQAKLRETMERVSEWLRDNEETDE